MFVNNVKMHEQLGNSDHNQIHVDIKVKSENNNKNIQERPMDATEEVSTFEGLFTYT